MQSGKIRTLFLDYFKAKDHLVMPSFSLVPQNDPTLLLIGAGMAPLKPFFTGEKVPPHSRVATCQKCFRTPDINRVGLTGRHATFFEMLGNFSFGDYFKEEAIAWAWDLVLNEFKLPKDRLWVSVYHEDEEAFKIWNEHIGVPAERIKHLGKEDNFWEIGLGPCGPCSEIYYDLGEAAGCGQADCAVGCDCDRYLEIWNLVFTQFSREASGELVELKKKNIDTGAGLERLAMALQGVNSIYETDLLKPIYTHFQGQAGNKSSELEAPLRVVTEHSRGIVMMIGDGVIPSNEGRGYVLRRLMRRAIRYGNTLGMEDCFIADAVPLITDIMSEQYPELRERLDYIRQVTVQEEKRFQSTLIQGMEILEGYLQELPDEQKILSGQHAFKLYDTFGFPIDLTEEILQERGITVDLQSFQAKLRDQQERARAAVRQHKGTDDLTLYKSIEELITIFTGYKSLSEDTKIIHALIKGKAVQTVKQGDKADILLDQTPFYAESGGQVGDTGYIETADGKLQVENTFLSPWGQIIHKVTLMKGEVKVGDKATARVDIDRRRGICRSHSATHLLHRSLRTVLGDHVSQAGSLVDREKLRFDFNHFSALTSDELIRVEKEVNSMIINNITMEVSMTSMDEAKKMGAIALFVDKYEENSVRVIKTGDYTRELCGGTHVSATGEIGLFKIGSEESIGSGLRRITALVGMSAYEHVMKNDCLLDNIAHKLNTNRNDLDKRVDEYVLDFKSVLKQKQELEHQLVNYKVKALIPSAYEVRGINILKAAVVNANSEILRLMADQVKDSLKSVIVLLGTVVEGKVQLICAVTEDLVQQGFHAGRIVKEISALVKGGGGGNADMAQAGGTDPGSLPDALDSLTMLIEKQVNK